MSRGSDGSATTAPSDLHALLTAALDGSGRCLVVERGSHAPMFCEAATAEAERRRVRVRQAVASPYPFGAFEVVCDLLGVDPSGEEAEAICQAGMALPALHALAERVDVLCIDGPVLLVIDQAELADAASARFLRYLAGHLDARSVSVLLVAAEVAPRSWLEDLASTVGGVLRLRSEPDAAFRPVGGHHLSELEDHDRNVVEALAVLGPGASLAAVSAVSAEPADVVLATLDRLAAWRELRRTPRGAGHLIAADAVLDHLAPTRRAELHERAAVHGRSIGQSARWLATHLEHTAPGALAWAATHLRAGAALALQADDTRSAVRWLQRAIEEDQLHCREVPVDVLLDLAAAQARAGDPGVTATLRLAAEQAPVGQRRTLQIRLGRQLAAVGRLREAVAVYDDLLGDLDGAGDDHRDLRVRARVGLVMACRCSLELRPRSQALLQQLSTELREAGEVDPSVYAELAYEHALTGSPRQTVLELAHRAIAARPRLAPLAAHSAFLALVWAEDLQAAQELCDGLDAGAAQEPLRAHLQATIALARDDLDVAVSCARKAVADIEWVAPMLVPGAHAQLARALVRQGRLDRAAAALELPGGDGRWRHQASFHPVLLARAELAAARGEWSQAQSFAGECARFSRSMGTWNPAVVPWHPVAARALAELGRRPEADAVLADAIERADTFGAPGFRGRLEHVRAELDGALAGPAEPPPAAPSIAPSGVVLRLLGDTVLVVDGVEHPLGDDLADRAVCIVGLAAHGIHDEQLAEGLWPGGDPAVGRNRLRNVLLRARQRYGPILERRGRTVALRADIGVDVHDFDRLAGKALRADDPDDALRFGQQALALHAGELCPVHPFEPWAEGPRAATQQRWFALVDHLAELRARGGDLAGSLALTEAALAVDPWAEDRYLDAAERLVAADRPGAAQSLLRRCRRMCEELGVPPSPRHEALAAAVR